VRRAHQHAANGITVDTPATNRRVRRAHHHAANRITVDTRGAHGAPYQFFQQVEAFVIAKSVSDAAIS